METYHYHIRVQQLPKPKSEDTWSDSSPDEIPQLINISNIYQCNGRIDNMEKYVAFKDYLEITHDELLDDPYVICSLSLL